MSAPIVSYWQYDPATVRTCPVCGWQGDSDAANVEHHSDLLDVSCPSCDTMLVVVPYPTIDETAAAAAAGNQAAAAELASLERIHTASDEPTRTAIAAEELRARGLRIEPPE